MDVIINVYTTAKTRAERFRPITSRRGKNRACKASQAYPIFNPPKYCNTSALVKLTGRTVVTARKVLKGLRMKDRTAKECHINAEEKTIRDGEGI